MNYPIEEVLRIHNKAFTKARKLKPVADLLGDAFLLNHNLIYRNVRRKVLGLGYKTSAETFQECRSFPLISLPLIKKTRTIPYKDNVSALKYVVSRNRKLSLDIHYPLFDSNTLLHESAHVCADSIIREKIKRPKVSNHKARQIVLHQMLEESFANACEIAAWQIAGNRYERFFLSYNSYRSGHHLKSQAKWAPKRKAFFFNLLVLSHLCSNFLYRRIDRKQKTRLIALAQLANPYGAFSLDSKMKDQVDSTLEFGLRLSPQFRLITSDFYFRLLGFDKSINQLTNFDFIQTLESDSNYLLILKEFCSLVWNNHEK